jgi:hypothetical protein
MQQDDRLHADGSAAIYQGRLAAMLRRGHDAFHLEEKAGCRDNGTMTATWLILLAGVVAILLLVFVAYLLFRAQST